MPREKVERKPRKEIERKPETDEEKMAAEAICPTCGKEVFNHKCRLCGATKHINAVSGNVIWMRNGRVVEAFQDAKQAYIQMAQRYNIPESEYPEKFRPKKVR